MGRTAQREPCAEEFGARIRATRLRRKLSQEALGQRSGLSMHYVSSVERGERNVSLFNILRLARALDMDASTLVRNLPEPPDRGRY